MKAIIVLRRGQRLTANQNRALFERFSRIVELSTPCTCPMTPAETEVFYQEVFREMETHRENPTIVSVVLAANEPFLLRKLSYWTVDSNNSSVRILWTGDTGDSGWQIL